MVGADYFDGRSTRVRAVCLQLAGEDLHIAGEDIDERVPFARVTVDERLGRAPRRLRLPGGAFCVVRDLPALDALLASAAHRDGWVDRMQRRAHSVVPAIAVCAVLAAAGYRWGLPWAAAVGAAHMPPAVGKAISVETLKILDGKVLLASRIGAERRQSIDAGFRALRLPEGGTVHAALLFRRSPQLGANAFALPDGTIIVLDDLIAVLDDRQILAVLAHELGHVHGHHGLQLLLQSSVAGALLSFYVGDFSALLAAAPAALMQARYSRDLEAQADDYGAAVLARNGMSPALLAEALTTLAKSHGAAEPAQFLSSHPPTDERIRRLHALGASPEKPRLSAPP